MNYYHLKAIRQNHSYHYNAKIGAVVKAHALGGVYMGKLAPARVSYRDDFVISYHVYIDDWVISYHVYMKTESKSQTRRPSSLTKITHALPVPVYLQTDFTPKRVVVSRLHETAAKSRTGVKFSPRCENRGELKPGRLVPA